jgi:hypothetical protein
MSRDTVNFADFLPSTPLYAPQEHISGRKIAFGQALIDENLRFELSGCISPSRRQWLAIVVAYQHKLLVLEALHMPLESAKDIARQISYGRSIACPIFVRNPS